MEHIDVKQNGVRDKYHDQNGFVRCKTIERYIVACIFHAIDGIFLEYLTIKLRAFTSIVRYVYILTVVSVLLLI